MAFIENQSSVLISLGKVSSVKVELEATKPELSVASVLSGSTIYLILEGKIDVEKEKERLLKEKQDLRI